MAVTHGVVTPNMDSATAGLLSSDDCGPVRAPSSALAALPSTRRDIRFKPAMSVTEGNSTTSEQST